MKKSNVMADDIKMKSDNYEIGFTWKRFLLFVGSFVTAAAILFGFYTLITTYWPVMIILCIVALIIAVLFAPAALL